MLGNDSDDFEEFYGATNAAIARTIVDRAIQDWEAVILDSDLAIDIFAGAITGRGITQNLTFSNGRPTSADITLDDNGGGDSWYFDPTPFDDAEFTAIANTGDPAGASFHASFVDVAAGYVDFYRTIVHEIGHAVGLITGAVFTSTNPLMTFIGPDPLGGGNLYSFHNPNGPYGVTATFTTNGGRHLFEGDHPNELMNPGRITQIGQPNETLRQFISDFTVQLLADGYGYNVVLPSTFDTAHVTLDSQTGTLLVQGGVDTLGNGQVDSISIDIVGSDYRVQVDNTLNGMTVETTELVPIAHVSQIVIAQNGGNDTQSVSIFNIVPVINVQYVVSSNQDLATASVLNDLLVDSDAAVPGRQTPLREAIRDANGTSGDQSIYVPRGLYEMTLTGTGGDTQGDFDIATNITIVGSGAGEAIIDASGLGTTNSDRIFDVAANATLNLSHVTLTGGRSTSQVGSHGGAIFVRNGATLVLANTTLADNEAVGANSNGGAIYFETTASGTITSSVITGNHAGNTTGGVFLQGSSPNGAVTLTRTIVGNNSAVSTTGLNVRAGTGRSFTSGGYNRLTSGGPGFTALASDHIGTATYIVTGWSDSYDSTNNSVVVSLREAVEASNLVSGQQEIWLPA